MKTVARIRNDELRVAAVDVVTGELRVFAEIFAVRSTIDAFAIRPAEPRNSDAITN